LTHVSDFTPAAALRFTQRLRSSMARSSMMRR
jgi:hypothetical protein